MKNILITGFEPFGEYTENLSEVAATKLKIIADYNVYSLIFPVRIFPHQTNRITSYLVNGKRHFFKEPVGENYTL